jgi:hypothetical protein
MDQYQSEYHTTNGKQNFYVGENIEVELKDGSRVSGKVQFISGRGIYFHTDAKKPLYCRNDSIKLIARLG